LFSQLKGQGVSGEAAGTPLTRVPVALTAWGTWKRLHPATTVLSRQMDLPDFVEPAPGQGPTFPVVPVSDRLPQRERVLGVFAGGEAAALPTSAFAARPGPHTVAVGGKRLTVEYDDTAGTLRVVDADDGVDWAYSLWFAWHAFWPEAGVIEPAG
jgi:hypothetical protein